MMIMCWVMLWGCLLGVKTLAAGVAGRPPLTGGCGLVVTTDSRYNPRPTHHAPCQMAPKGAPLAAGR